MSASLASNGMDRASFCRPSLGPTSKIVTAPETRLATRFLLEIDEAVARLQLLPFLDEHFLHPTRDGRLDGELHLHGFNQHERVAGRDLRAVRDKHLPHFPGKLGDQVGAGAAASGGAALLELEITVEQAPANAHTELALGLDERDAATRAVRAFGDDPAAGPQAEFPLPVARECESLAGDPVSR